MQHTDPRLKVIPILMRLGIVGIKIHKFSYAAMMTGSVKISPDWIPLSIVDISAQFLEITPFSKMDAE